MKKTLLFTLCMIWALCVISQAGDFRRNFVIGLGYPYLSFGYRAANDFSYELRGAAGTGIQTYGIRLTNYARSGYYLSGEWDTLGYESEYTTGKGRIIGVFAGKELPLKIKNLTLTADAGMVNISLNSDDFNGLVNSGSEIVVNFGLNYYFCIHKQEKTTVLPPPHVEPKKTAEPPKQKKKTHKYIKD